MLSFMAENAMLLLVGLRLVSSVDDGVCIEDSGSVGKSVMVVVMRQV